MQMIANERWMYFYIIQRKCLHQTYAAVCIHTYLIQFVTNEFINA